MTYWNETAQSMGYSRSPSLKYKDFLMRQMTEDHENHQNRFIIIEQSEIHLVMFVQLNLISSTIGIALKLDVGREKISKN